MILSGKLLVVDVEKGLVYDSFGKIAGEVFAITNPITNGPHLGIFGMTCAPAAYTITSNVTCLESVEESPARSIKL